MVFLDITATVENRKTLTELVKHVAKEINIPFTVGGGIKSVEDARAIIKAGADKVSINSSAVERPQLIAELVEQFGSQCVVLAIDTKLETNGEWIVYTHGGGTSTHLNTVEWAIKGEKLGAGEILLTSMNNDGMKSGFAIDITDQVTKALNIPVIASGGAGNMSHFAEVFNKTKASGALGASVFHFNEVAIPALKDYLKEQNIAIR